MDPELVAPHPPDDEDLNLSEEDMGEEEEGTDYDVSSDDDWEGNMRRMREDGNKYGRRGSSRWGPKTTNDHQSTSEEPKESGEVEERCVVCCAKATLTCRRCLDEYYCSHHHLNYHKRNHQAMCVPKSSRGAMNNRGAGSVAEFDENGPSLSQDSALLCLPEKVLLVICRYLSGVDLVRLGWVCRSLRALCRNQRSWSHVTFAHDGPHDRDVYPEQFQAHGSARPRKGPRLNKFGVLRVAPALHTLVVRDDGRGPRHMWPPVNLLRCTNNVQVFQYYPFEDQQDSDKNRLFHTIAHYREHLQVLMLSELQDMRTFRLIDGLEKIRELHIGPGLVKAYPGSDKKVTSLELGWFVSRRVAAEILRANRDTLTSLLVDDENDNDWLDDSPKSPVCRALKECKNLQEVRTLTGSPWPTPRPAYW